MGKINYYQIFVRKPDGKRPLGRRELGIKRVQWVAAVTTVIKHKMLRMS
jgi:hypothetical protein